MGRDTLVARLRAKAKEGKPVIGAGAGTGLSAKCAEAGGADLIIIYNSGRYRMAGRGSLAGLMPYGDANAIVMEMAGEVLPVVRDVPVLAGVCGTDPFRLMPRFLDELAAVGFAGVQNFPTVGLIDGVFRQNLEETGMSYAAEVEMIRLAAQRGLLTCPYVFDPQQADQMARAGADVLVPHMGLTTSGTIGARTALTLDEAVERVQAMRDAAVAVNPEILVLCHGGPIAEPDDAGYVLARTTGVCGFFGASSMERLPVERALTAQVRAFTELSFRLSRAGGSRHDREAHQARADRDVQLRVGHDEMVRVSGDNPGSGQLPGRGNHQPRPGARQAPARARRRADLRHLRDWHADRRGRGIPDHRGRCGLHPDGDPALHHEHRMAHAPADRHLHPRR